MFFFLNVYSFIIVTDKFEIDVFKFKFKFILLPKIDEIREILRETQVSILGITESKLDSTVCESEVLIDGYQILRSDRNRHGGGVACYIRDDIVFNLIRPLTSASLEYLMFEVHLPKTDAFTVCIFYRPPTQNSFLTVLYNEFLTLDLSKEFYILGDLNVNLLIAGEYALTKFRSETKLAKVHPLLPKYKDFCSIFGMTQLIRDPTRQSALLDHILSNCSEKITQSGVMSVGISDHN